MNIGLNGQMLTIDKFAGPEVYTFNVFRNIALSDKENKYIVYFKSNPTDELWKKLTENNPNFSFRVLGNKISWTQWGLLWELITHPVDIFFGATHTIPIIHHPKTKIISMIHGLEYKINKQYEKNSFKYLLHPTILWWVLTFSKVIVVPSVATKNAIVNSNFLLFNSKKIRVIGEGVDEKFYKRSQEEVNVIKNKYKINFDEYLIFVSTIQPRKNIPVMVNAFSRLVKDNKNICLLICGKLGWLYQESIEAPKKYRVEKNVKFLGRVPDEDLPILLSGARYFISLSLEEGFGIPLLEAMACQLPAIVSDISSFKEIGKDTQTYVDPNNLEKITHALKNAFSRSADQNNISNAYNISKKYTWNNTAKELISLFNSIHKNG